MVPTDDQERRDTPFAALVDGLAMRLRLEPVAMSVALGVVAAALTDSVIAFALGGAAAWFTALRLRRRPGPL
jgi:hypothetical protein